MPLIDSMPSVSGVYPHPKKTYNMRSGSRPFSFNVKIGEGYAIRHFDSEAEAVAARNQLLKEIS